MVVKQFDDSDGNFDLLGETEIQEAAIPRALFVFTETWVRPIRKMAPLPMSEGIAAAVKAVVSGKCRESMMPPKIGPTIDPPLLAVPRILSIPKADSQEWLSYYPFRKETRVK